MAPVRSYADRARSSRRASRATRILASICGTLAAFFAGSFIFGGLLRGEWTFLLLPSTIIMVTSTISLRLSSSDYAQAAARWEHLAFSRPGGVA